MALAPTLKQFLDQHHADYEVVRHPHSVTSMRTAELAHVPGDLLAKSVVLRDARGFVLAVLPATHQLDLNQLDRRLHRVLDFASEPEFAALFRDCEPGAVPAIGAAYGIETVIDEQLVGPADIYFEAGDHEALVHMSSEQFRLLTDAAPHGRISRHV